MLKTGKKVKRRRHNTMAANDGRISREMFSRLSPEMADATNRLMPYGGEIKPHARLTVMMSPK